MLNLNLKEKRQIILLIAMALIGFLVAGVLLFSNTSGGFIQISGYEIVRDVFKSAFEWTWGFLWLFGSMFWSLFTSSWISAVVILGGIALLVLKYYYEKNDRIDS